MVQDILLGGLDQLRRPRQHSRRQKTGQKRTFRRPSDRPAFRNWLRHIELHRVFEHITKVVRFVRPHVRLGGDAKSRVD